MTGANYIAIKISKCSGENLQIFIVRMDFKGIEKEFNILIERIDIQKDICLGIYVLDKTPKLQAIKAKTDNWNLPYE